METKQNILSKNDQRRFKTFVDNEVIPNANQFDQAEQIPTEFIAKLAQQGYLGAILPGKYEGQGMDLITYGRLNEELGRGCASVRGLMMVQNMIASTLFKWGSEVQKEKWLSKIARGEIIAAFALTEPEIGSNAVNISTSLSEEDDSRFIINGNKRWVTFGQIADLFLVFGKIKDKLCAILLEKETPGLTIKPITGMLGTRASMLADLHLDNCPVPQGNLVGRIGFGFVPVGLTALNLGRYSIAWGCVGLGQACLEASLQHVSTRKQFGVHLRKHQLIQKMITDMVVNIKAARMLSCQAGETQENGESDGIMEIMEAKYFASKMAFKVANNAVQIHGAIGCSSESVVERHLRDAKIMEIIEGTSQIHQIKIAEYACRGYK